MTDFKWTSNREKAALALAEGYTNEEAAEQASVAVSTIYNWKRHPEFMAEVNRLTLAANVAQRAERLRIAFRVVREKVRNGVETNKDLLDWLKYAQDETSPKATANLNVDMSQLTNEQLERIANGEDVLSVLVGS